MGQVQVGLQDFLVCIEMFIAACTHKYTFGSETYADGSLRLIMEQRALYLAEQSYKVRPQCTSANDRLRYDQSKDRSGMSKFSHRLENGSERRSLLVVLLWSCLFPPRVSSVEWTPKRLRGLRWS